MKVKYMSECKPANEKRWQRNDPKNFTNHSSALNQATKPSGRCFAIDNGWQQHQPSDFPNPESQLQVSSCSV